MMTAAGRGSRALICARASSRRWFESRMLSLSAGELSAGVVYCGPMTWVSDMITTRAGADVAGSELDEQALTRTAPSTRRRAELTGASVRAAVARSAVAGRQLLTVGEVRCCVNVTPL